MSEDCFVCRKHAGKEQAPPGGYLYEDEHWMVCLAQPHMGPLGTLFIESKRHFLDYAEMTDEEAISLGIVLRKVFQALRQQLTPHRIYQLMTMEGMPHYHSWLVPRGREIPEKGLKFLARDDSCTEEEALALADALARALR